MLLTAMQAFEGGDCNKVTYPSDPSLRLDRRRVIPPVYGANRQTLAQFNALNVALRDSL